ncbi:MAG: hypothetical protein WCY14_08660, partial [Arcobacteraceae bacterium]
SGITDTMALAAANFISLLISLALSFRVPLNIAGKPSCCVNTYSRPITFNDIFIDLRDIFMNFSL